MRDIVACFSADPEFVSCHRHIGFLHQFIEGLGRHPIAKKDADKRRKHLADRMQAVLLLPIAREGIPTA